MRDWVFLMYTYLLLPLQTPPLLLLLLLLLLRQPQQLLKGVLLVLRLPSRFSPGAMCRELRSQNQLKLYKPYTLMYYRISK